MDTSGTTCYECPDHAVCFDGNMIEVDPGYWGDEKHPAGEFFRCHPPRDKCMSGRNASKCEEGCACSAPQPCLIYVVVSDIRVFYVECATTVESSLQGHAPSVRNLVVYHGWPIWSLGSSYLAYSL